MRVELLSVHERPTRRRNLRIVEASVRDDSGAATAIWFNQRFLARTLKPGPAAAAARRGARRGGGLELAVRDHEIVWRRRGRACHTVGLVPVYDASRTLSTRVLHELVEQHLPRTDAIADPLPAVLRVARRLPLRRDAIAALHAPRTPGETRIAGDRLAYEELLLLQLALQPSAAPAAPEAEPLGRPGELLQRYRASLPFTLTTGQTRSDPRHRPRPARAAARCGACCSATSAPARPSWPCTRCCAPSSDGAQGGADGADRDARAAARATVRKLVEPLGLDVAARHRRRAARREARPPAAHRLGRRGARGRHARAARGQRRVRAAERDRGRRAAPLRRRAARRARRGATARTRCT